MELYVYEHGSFDYNYRDMRRTTFMVIKGFSKLDVEIPSKLELFETKELSVTLTEELNGNPLFNQEVSIYTLNDEETEYILIDNKRTGFDGKISVNIPESDIAGLKSIRAEYTGSENYHSVYNCNKKDL